LPSIITIIQTPKDRQWEGGNLLSSYVPHTSIREEIEASNFIGSWKGSRRLRKKG